MVKLSGWFLLIAAASCLAVVAAVPRRHRDHDHHDDKICSRAETGCFYPCYFAGYATLKLAKNDTQVAVPDTGCKVTALRARVCGEEPVTITFNEFKEVIVSPRTGEDLADYSVSIYCG